MGGIAQIKTPASWRGFFYGFLLGGDIPRGRDYSFCAEGVSGTGAPAAIPAKTSGRRELAEWMVAPENPLTARVFMNRLWKQFFGNALSAQVNDLGAQGEWPTHPELLDWLASRFVESGWSIKAMHRLIMNSAVYQQA